jgi:hypothetical protein
MLRTIGICALVLSLSSVAFAKVKLMQPPSVQDARWSVLHAAGVKNQYQGQHRVSQVGVTNDGRTVMAVRSSEFNKPVFMIVKKVREDSYWTIKASKLTDNQFNQLDLVSPAKARKIAGENGGIFGSVKGTMKNAGASKNGQAYKFVITPKEAKEVKVPYGTYTVTELTRWVNVRGKGESAAPTGTSKFKYQPGN